MPIDRISFVPADFITALALLVGVSALLDLVNVLIKAGTDSIAKVVRQRSQLTTKVLQTVGRLNAMELFSLRRYTGLLERLFSLINVSGRMSFYPLSALACVCPSSCLVAPYIKAIFVSSLLTILDCSAMKTSFKRVCRSLLTRLKTCRIVGKLTVLSKNATVSAAKHVLGIDLVQLLKDFDDVQANVTALQAYINSEDQTREDDRRAIREKDRALAYKDSTIRVQDREFALQCQEVLQLEGLLAEKDAALQAANTKLERYTQHGIDIKGTPTLISEQVVVSHPLFQILSRTNHSLAHQADVHRREREELDATILRHREEWARLRGENEELATQLAACKAACTKLESRAVNLRSRLKDLEKTYERRASAHSRRTPTGGVQEVLDELDRLRTESSSHRMELETCRTNERSAREKVEELQVANGQMAANYHILRDQINTIRSTQA